MFKNKKGVTLISLAVTVLVMIIILGITVATADNLLRETDERKLKTNLYLIKARAQTLLDDYLFDGTDKLGDTTSEDITTYGWTEDETQFIYREWDSEDLKVQGIDTSNVAKNEVFIIKYDFVNEEIDIASTRGVVDSDGIARYTLSSLEE